MHVGAESERHDARLQHFARHGEAEWRAVADIDEHTLGDRLAHDRMEMARKHRRSRRMAGEGMRQHIAGVEQPDDVAEIASAS